jgi:hypothetical protein
MADRMNSSSVACWAYISPVVDWTSRLTTTYESVEGCEIVTDRVTVINGLGATIGTVWQKALVSRVAARPDVVRAHGAAVPKALPVANNIHHHYHHHHHHQEAYYRISRVVRPVMNHHACTLPAIGMHDLDAWWVHNRLLANVVGVCLQSLLSDRWMKKKGLHGENRQHTLSQRSTEND